MNAQCILSSMPGGSWRIRHSSSALGDVEVTGTSREEAVTKMRSELQYRWELCPCSGESVGQVQLDIKESTERQP